MVLHVHEIASVWYRYLSERAYKDVNKRNKNKKSETEVKYP